MSSPDPDDAEILILINEIGIPRDQKSNLIEGFTEKIGMTLDERFGTLAFSGNLSVLNSMTDAIVQFINEFQISGGIFPAIRRETIDREFRDNLLRYAIFQRYWRVEDERAVILTFDINHLGGRAAKKHYALQRVGALKIYPSCYWIPEAKIDFIRDKFGEIVGESRESRTQEHSNRRIDYHYRVFRCYPIGSPEGLKRWKDLQLSIVLRKINSLYARTKGKYNFFRYARSSYPTLTYRESLPILRKIKKLKSWRQDALRELDPYKRSHLRRLRSMGINQQKMSDILEIQVYDPNGNDRDEGGNLLKLEEEINLNIEEGIERLYDILSDLNGEVSEFLRTISEQQQDPNPTPITSDQFGS